MEAYQQQLRSLYEREKIAVQNFDCRHKDTCIHDALQAWSRNPVASSRHLLHGAEAHIGTCYGQLTRIVVLSLDVGSSTDPMTRTLVGRREVIESIDPATANAHMRGTFEILDAILGPELKGALPWPYFALLNAAKCSGSVGMDKVPDSLYSRCRPFAQAEIAALQPEILVAQGTTAKYLLPDLDKVPFSDWQPFLTHLGIAKASPVDGWLAAVIEDYCRFTRIQSTKAIVLLTPHPSDRQGRWQLFRRLNLPICAWIVRKLIEAQRQQARV